MIQAKETAFYEVGALPHINGKKRRDTSLILHISSGWLPAWSEFRYMGSKMDHLRIDFTQIIGILGNVLKKNANKQLGCLVYHLGKTLVNVA